MKIKKVSMLYVDYLGMRKTVELTPEQVKDISKMSYKEAVKRLAFACRDYSKKYWVTGFINDKEVCHFQWAEV